MNVLVVGGHCQNKGAQLMLLAVEHALKRCNPSIKVFVTPLAGQWKVLKTMGYEIFPFPLPHIGSRFYAPMMKVPGAKDILRGTLRKMDGVLDISGFAYGDQMGLRAVRNASCLTSIIHGMNIPFILMPQALGPFESPALRDAFVRFSSDADLIFARDKTSFSHVVSTIGQCPKVRQCPDFTLAYKPDGLGRKNVSGMDPYSCIVPNIRMLDQGKSAWAGRYLRLLADTANHLSKVYGHRIVLVVHSAGPGDLKLARKLQNMMDVPCVLESASDPGRLKSVLAGSNLVVGSRFHALASALSCSVPSISLGWSHKYDELFCEYAMDGYSFLDPSGYSVRVLDKLLSAEVYHSCCATLDEINRKVRKQVEDMWQSVEMAMAKV